MRKRFDKLGMALVLSALALSACASPHPDALAHAHGHDVALYLRPGVSGENNDLRIEVRGARIPEISEVALTMPDMGMKTRHVALQDTGTGSYDASNVRFDMAGKWHVSVLERGPNGSREFAAFDVTVR